MLLSAAEYRERAKECLHMASQARERDRPTFIQLADAWMKLADQSDYEDRTMRGESNNGTPHP
jgi:hypothetical protein